MGDSFWGSPWLWGLIGVGAGLAIGAKFMGPELPVNPVVEINELRSDWTIECIKEPRRRITRRLRRRSTTARSRA